MHMLNNEQFNGIQLIKTKGKHGRGEILKRTGTVSGIAFKHENEKTLYVAGDTVWNTGRAFKERTGRAQDAA